VGLGTTPTFVDVTAVIDFQVSFTITVIETLDFVGTHRTIEGDLTFQVIVSFFLT
jgi:hypothetical protein